MSKPGVTVTETMVPEQPIRLDNPSIHTLAELLPHVRYKPGWSFGIYAHASSLRSLFITVDTENSVEGLRSSIDPAYDVKLGQTIKIDHYLLIPPDANYSREEWEHWVLKQIILVEQHEACEFFKVDGKAIYHPYHGHEGNPYVIPERRG